MTFLTNLDQIFANLGLIEMAKYQLKLLEYQNSKYFGGLKFSDETRNRQTLRIANWLSMPLSPESTQKMTGVAISTLPSPYNPNGSGNSPTPGSPPLPQDQQLGLGIPSKRNSKTRPHESAPHARPEPHFQMGYQRSGRAISL